MLWLRVHGERLEPAEERRQQLASIFGSAPADDTPVFLLRVDDLDIPWPPGMTAKEALLSWAAEWLATHLHITHPGLRSEAFVADLRAQGWKEEMWSPAIAVFKRASVDA